MPATNQHQPITVEILEEVLDRKFDEKLASYATKQYVQDELFKHNTLLAESFNKIYDRFDQIDRRFVKMDQRFDQLEEKMATKQNLLNLEVKLWGEQRMICEEQAAGVHARVRQDELLEDHEQRLERIETHPKLNLMQA